MTVTLNPLYRFDTFVVGSANRLAVASPMLACRHRQTGTSKRKP